jgi:GNAT superfamily N-acetyltransferase
VKIRLAEPGDAATLARMRYAFRTEMNEPAEDEAAFVARCGEWMADRLEPGGAWRCWVAENAAGAIRGHLWLQLIEKIPNPGPELESHGYVTNVFVDPEARGAGAGRLLMETALAFCREDSVDSVILWPTERSRTLYARHGFVEPDDMMELVRDSGRDLH